MALIDDVAQYLIDYGIPSKDAWDHLSEYSDHGRELIIQRMREIEQECE